MPRESMESGAAGRDGAPGYVLVTWNPALWSEEPWTLERWDDLAVQVNAGRPLAESWNVGRRKTGITTGDRAYMLLQGDGPRGIIARGTVLSSAPSEAESFAGPGSRMYVDISWESARRLDDRLSIEELDARVSYHWRFVLNSGQDATAIGPQLDALWDGVDTVDLSTRAAALEEYFTLRRSQLHPGPYGGVPAPPPGQSSRTASPANFERFLAVAAAPKALTLFALYANAVGLPPGDERWQVSCLPQASRQAGRTRMGRITVATDGTFFVTTDTATGRDVRWWLAAPPRVDATTFRLGRADNGGIGYVGAEVNEFVALLADPDTLLSARDRVSSTLATTRASDRGWHNVALAELLDLGEQVPTGVETDSTPGTVGDTTPILARYVEVSSRIRLHQKAFRTLLFGDGRDVACAVCGLAEVRVLEAAHIVPDAEGGPSSRENGAILCATHHRAFDAGLMNYEGGRFVWAEGVMPFHAASDREQS